MTRREEGNEYQPRRASGVAWRGAFRDAYCAWRDKYEAETGRSVHIPLLEILDDATRRAYEEMEAEKEST